MKLIPLRARDGSTRAYAKVDDEDFDRLNALRWSLSGCGYVMNSKRRRYLHQEVLRLGRGERADHINRDPLDCQKGNLRQATHAENAQNTASRAGSTSPYRGVSWDAGRGKWFAKIQVGGRQIALGRFDEEVDAAEAARVARLEQMPFATA